jgi:D-3-phosphoglycerate dehydrogenase
VIHNGSAVLCDLREAARRGIVVLHVPGANAQSVAEHTIALLLDVWKRVTVSDRSIRSGETWHTGDPGLMTSELQGKTLGLVGFGHVAQRVALIAKMGLGMRVLVWSRRQQPVELAGYEWCNRLDDVLRQADALSVHVAVNDATIGLLDADRITIMKPGAIIINTARESLVDSVAIAAALVDGRLGGAGFDVWPGNGPESAFALLRTPNTVLTPHNAGFTAEAAARSMEAVRLAMLAVLRGEEPTTARVVHSAV